jgi:hypothetical protein
MVHLGEWRRLPHHHLHSVRCTSYQCAGGSNLARQWQRLAKRVAAWFWCSKGVVEGSFYRGGGSLACRAKTPQPIPTRFDPSNDEFHSFTAQGCSSGSVRTRRQRNGRRAAAWRHTCPGVWEHGQGIEPWGEKMGHAVVEKFRGK